MGFYQMMELLQKKENGKIIMCNLGNFYVAIGKDATLLNNLLGLKVSCVKPEVCKVGFPVCALEKYTELLVQKRYSFIVYDFDQKKEELKILESYEGKNKNKLTDRNINCYICSKSTQKYKRPDKYILALSKLYEEELENDSSNNIVEERDGNNIEKEKIKERKRKRKIWFQSKNRKIN